MGNNTNDKYQPMKVYDKVQRKNDKTNHAYEVTKVIDKGSPDETEVKIKSTKNGHETQLKQKSLKLCSDENPSSPIVQTDPSTQSETDSSTPVLTAVTSAPAAVSDVPHTPENAPTAAADKPAGTEPISTAPSSDAPVQTSENSLTPMTDDATNPISPILPVSSSPLESKHSKQDIHPDEALAILTEEMRAIPTLYSFVQKIIGLFSGNGVRRDSAKVFVRDVTSGLEKLETKVRELQSQLIQARRDTKDRTTERDKYKGEAEQKVKELDAKSVDLKNSERGAEDTRTELRTKEQENKTLTTNLAESRTQNTDAKGKWGTERGKLNASVQSEKQRADKAEVESNGRQTKLEASERRLKGALNDFWKGRQEFYGALHRGMEQFRGKNADRYEDAQESRQESIKSDTQLLKGLGCQVTLEEEAVNLKQLSYDGADHQPFGTETINHKTDATVLLPGWSYPDGEIGAKPVLSGKEIKQ